MKGLYFVFVFECETNVKLLRFMLMLNSKRLWWSGLFWPAFQLKGYLKLFQVRSSAGKYKYGRALMILYFASFSKTFIVHVNDFVNPEKLFYHSAYTLIAGWLLFSFDTHFYWLVYRCHIQRDDETSKFKTSSASRPECITLNQEIIKIKVFPRAQKKKTNQIKSQKLA